MSCATSTVKFSFFFFNAIWLIVGILVIGVGALSFGELGNLFAILILVGGVVILLTSLFGYYGAVREAPRMLWMYVSLLLTLLVGMLIFIILHPKDKIKNYAIQEIKDQWKLEETHPGSMDTIQTTYQCCGLNGSADYLFSTAMMYNTIPYSCYEDYDSGNINREGCLRKVEQFFEDDDNLEVGYKDWLLFGFMVVLIVLGAILAINYTKSQRRFNY
ncbi:protein late bloomer-like [Drosophila rhopaloa]|uniref:Protein late bloomer-like n=1 Tax=Drosophila rhopaloa TaxID=1041015 RepID=A0A6P4EKF2_DRORH|nr:protein late bloomer-like [Drosophila rhopaloa]